MPPFLPPVIVFCATGLAHVLMCVWAIRSLRRFGYDAIEVIVGKESERKLLHEHLGYVQCEVIDADLQGYGMWAWRPFVLEQYSIKHVERDVVICDTDILWIQDPYPLFDRFSGLPWVHKITSLDPGELDDYKNLNDILQRRIGLRTMVAYHVRVGLKQYPNFHLNCGLFMLPRDTFPNVLKHWVAAIGSVPPQEMIMTEALLALVYAELSLAPVSDRQDIKHLGISHRTASRPIVSFQTVEPGLGQFTGYQTAKHYFGDQRPQLFKDVTVMGLDPDGLVREVNRIFKARRINDLLCLPVKAVRKLLRL